MILYNNTPPTVTGTNICVGQSGTISSSACPTVGPTTVGPRFAGTGTNSGTATWNNPGNVNSNDNIFTVTNNISNNGNSGILSATNFGFSIPSNATINGVQVTIGRFASGSVVRDNVVQLIIGGTQTGNNKAVTGNGTDWPTGAANEATRLYGGVSDLWGTALTAAQVNASNFGVALVARNTSGNTRTASVDYIQIAVTYTIIGATNWFTEPSGGTSFGSGNPFNPVGGGSDLLNTNTPGTYTFYAECSSTPGCRSAAANFVINPLPAQPADFTTLTSTVCPGTSGLIYTVPNDPAVTYTWSYSGTGATIFGSTNSVTVNFSGSATSGTLSVVANSPFGCPSSAPRSVAITVGASAQPGAFTASDASVCQGENGVVYTVPHDASVTYNWTYSGTGATINGTTNSVTVNFSPTATSGTLISYRYKYLRSKCTKVNRYNGQCSTCSNSG